jgi:hypothetical protein
MRIVRTTGSAGLAALALCVAACGSTVQQQGTVTVGGSNGLSAPGASSTGPATGLAPGSAGAAPGVAGGPASTATGSTGAAGSGTYGGGTTSGVQQAGDGPGVTATTINIGEVYEPDAAAADAAVGAASGNPGDVKAETIAVINYINSHGGIARRKLVPNWYNASLQKSVQTSAQEACAQWTQDSKTFIMSAGDFRGAGGIMDQCIANEHGLGLSSGDITMETTAINRKFPADINLTGLTNDRAMGYTIDGLARLGYFTKGAKVGIATWDDPNYHYGVDHVALPALARLGVHNVPVQYISSPSSYGDLSQTSAATSSAVLQFRATVDHVILFDGASGVAGGGILTLEWMQQAHSQSYHPKYGLNSGSGFNALSSDLPADELANSVGTSWEPPLDETSTAFNATPLTPAAKLCKKIMADAGQKVSGNNAIAIQYSICDSMFFLKLALDRVAGPLNQTNALAALNAIGSSYRSLSNFGVAVGPDRHDMPYLVRNMTYQSSCSCFNYVGPVFQPAD